MASLLRWTSRCQINKRGPFPRRFSVVRQRINREGWRTFVREQDAKTVGKAFVVAGPVAYCDEQNSFALVEWALNSFFPKGYPHSVRSNYLTYVQWTAVGYLSGRVQSVLATQAALFAIGLGAGAIPMAAAVNWVLKDGVGHAAGILYAAQINTHFDADAKRYRFQSTVALTIADFMAVFMPLCPQYFLLLASLISALSSMSHMAQMAARARVQASFSLQGNLADIARAGQTQAKLMSLIGTAIGAGLSWLIGPYPFSVASVMIPLACLSLYSTYASSCVVVLQSFNTQRTERLFKQLLQQLRSRPDGARGELLAKTPVEIAAVETFCLNHTPIFQQPMLLQPLISETARFQNFMSSSNTVGLDVVLPLLMLESEVDEVVDKQRVWSTAWHADCTYAIALHRQCFSHSGNTATNEHPVIVWYCAGATSRTKLQAVWHACVLRHALDQGEVAPVRDCHTFAQQTWPEVSTALERSGWDLNRVFLDGAGGFLQLDNQ